MAGADNDGADLMIGGVSQETDPPFCDVWLWILNICCSPLTDQISAEDGADLELTVLSGADIVLRCPALVIVRW